jgi:hypothetical protein
VPDDDTLIDGDEREVGVATGPELVHHVRLGSILERGFIDGPNCGSIARFFLAYLDHGHVFRREGA